MASTDASTPTALVHGQPGADVGTHIHPEPNSLESDMIEPGPVPAPWPPGRAGQGCGRVHEKTTGGRGKGGRERGESKGSIGDSTMSLFLQMEHK